MLLEQLHEHQVDVACNCIQLMLQQEHLPVPLQQAPQQAPQQAGALRGGGAPMPPGVFDPEAFQKQIEAGRASPQVPTTDWSIHYYN